ncbi:O-antigen ligase family protein [Streptomyces sp. 8N616]|uniref:O-antigen ligase family protein n=1 Tax=Streptomyces sp. 8N616 TaxID=3457414 RepID=UPI003FD61369
MKPYPRVLPAGAAAGAFGVAGAIGAAGAATKELLPGRLGILGVGAEVCFLAFSRWPYAILPAGIVGGTVAVGALGDTRVSLVVAVHAGILAIGCLALLARRTLLRTDDRPTRTAADVPMLAVAGLLPLAAAHGLARGNPSHEVMVATYEFAVIPGYFFLTTYTLPNRLAMKKAAVCYLVGAAALAAAELTMPTRHGGLLSALALPPLLVAASHARGWKRAGLAVLIALLGVDAVMAGYRAVWLATGLALLVLLVKGSWQVRRGILTAAMAGAVLVPLAVAVSPGLQARASLAVDQVHQSAGHRLPEAAVGMDVFMAQPLIGGGLGHVTPPVYLPDYTVTTVGPVYHVFYVMVLANLGLVGLLVLWPLLRAIRTSLAAPDDYAVAFAALTCGFLAAVAFAGPTDGHWELGLLPAVALLTSQTALRPPAPAREKPS